MSAYDTDPEAKAYIDKRVQEINEQIYPTLSSTDCSFEEYKAGIKRERELWREIRAKDKDYFLAAY